MLTGKKEYCENCKGALFFEAGGHIFRTVCECQAKKYEEEEAERERIRKAEKFKLNQVNSLMGSDYLQATFKTSKINGANKEVFEKAKNYCKRYIDVFKDNHGIYILGDNSTGKTHLAACIANDLMQKGLDVIFTSLGKIMSATFTDNMIFSKIEKVPFLFLDDLGKEFIGRESEPQKSKYTESVLKQVLDLRVSNKKPIIITSNYSLDKLATELKLDRAIMERLNVAISRTWELNGTNFRDLIVEQKIKKADKLGI